MSKSLNLKCLGRLFFTLTKYTLQLVESLSKYSIGVASCDRGRFFHPYKIHTSSS